MLHLQPQLLATPFNKRRAISLSGFAILFEGFEFRRRRVEFHSFGAVERDSEFEVDPDKAREALKKLDEQLQSISQKQINPPRIMASDLKARRNQTVDGDGAEMSGSFLGNLAFGLLLFSVLYNILFLTVIKPAIEGPEEVPAAPSVAEEAPAAVILQQLPTYQRLVSTMNINK